MVVDGFEDPQVVAVDLQVVQDIVVDIDTVVVDQVVDLFVADQHLEDKGRDFERQMDKEIALLTYLPVFMIMNKFNFDIYMSNVQTIYSYYGL